MTNIVFLHFNLTAEEKHILDKAEDILKNIQTIVDEELSFDITYSEIFDIYNEESDYETIKIE